MRVSSDISRLPGIEDAAILMGTEANINMLVEIGLYSTELESVRLDDLIIVIKSADEKAVIAAFNEAEFQLLGNASGSSAKSEMKGKDYYSIKEAKRQNPDANLVIISIRGNYAAVEARKALELGMNVMIFSDNVTLEDEIDLKEFADKNDLIVMGPDCGTAIIQGKGICFSNELRRGNIGIVGAAGTGIQELGVLIDLLGGGISQAIGTGGRDLKAEVRGISMRKGIDILHQDPSTSIIVLLSKLADTRTYAEKFYRNARRSQNQLLLPLSAMIGCSRSLKIQHLFPRLSRLQLSQSTCLGPGLRKDRRDCIMR